MSVSLGSMLMNENKTYYLDEREEFCPIVKFLFQLYSDFKFDPSPLALFL